MIIPSLLFSSGFVRIYVCVFQPYKTKQQRGRLLES